MAAEPTRISFGPYQADLRSGELWKGTIRVKLQDLPFRVLAVLLRSPGELVTREELQRELWGDSTFVDFEHGLNAAVNKLRAALLDSPAKPRYIETLDRRGYRFIGKVDAGALTQAKQEAERSIAILPFTAQTEDSKYQFFGDSLADLLSTHLAKRPGLRVVARSVAGQFNAPQMDLAKLARELSVDLVVTGWIRQIGSQLIAYVELVDAKTGSLRWSDRFSSGLADLLTLESEIGPKIAEALQLRAEPQKKSAESSLTPDSEANYLYLQGRYHFQRRPEAGRVLKSIDCFEKAIALQPGFALAYAGLADSYATLGSFEAGDAAPMEVWPKAEHAANRALAINPSLAEAHVSLAYQKLHYGWDWPGAEEEFRKALALDARAAAAQHWYSHLLASLGRMEESLSASQAALIAEPFDPLLNAHLAWHFYMAQDFGLAVEQSERTLELDRYSHYGHFYVAAALEQLGEFGPAIDHFRKAWEISGALSMQTGLAHAFASAGDQAEARRQLELLRKEALHRYVSSYELALIHAQLGDLDTGFELLRAAVRERSGWIPYLDTDPKAAILRKDPRFVEIARLVRNSARTAASA